MKNSFLIILSIFLLAGGCSVIKPQSNINNRASEFKRKSFLPVKARTLLNNGIRKIEAGKIDESIIDFQNMVNLYPDISIAYYNLGLAYAKNNQLNKAINSWEQAVLLDNDYADAYYNLALAYKLLLDNKKAVEHFTNYIRLNPNDPDIAEIKKEIAQLIEPYIGKGVIGRISMTDLVDFENNIALSTKNIFKPDSPCIYTCVEVIDALKDTDVKVIWYYLTPDNQKLPVNLLKFKIEGSKNLLLSLVKPKKEWPTGQYELDIIVNGQVNNIVPFDIIR